MGYEFLAVSNKTLLVLVMKQYFSYQYTSEMWPRSHYPLKFILTHSSHITGLNGEPWHGTVPVKCWSYWRKYGNIIIIVSHSDIIATLHSSFPYTVGKGV